jgi:hypothetical protein
MKLTAEDTEDLKNLKVTEVCVLNNEDFDSFVKSLEEHPFEKNDKAQELLKRKCFYGNPSKENKAVLDFPEQKRIWEVEGEGESSFTDSLKSDPTWKEVVSE